MTKREAAIAAVKLFERRTCHAPRVASDWIE
jgi:hypothetical protein